MRKLFFVKVAKHAKIAKVAKDVKEKHARKSIHALQCPIDPYLRYMYNIHTMITDEYIDFEWDDRKAAINLEKHGVSFESAANAFSDVYARIVPDTKHSDDEERFFLLGMDLEARILTVYYCERRYGSVIRIISARKSTKTEEQQYWRYRND